MAWTGSPYSHVGWIQGSDVVEVIRSGSRTLPLSEYPRGYDVAELVSSDQAALDRLETLVASRRGADVPYDRAAILAIVLRGLTGFRWCWLEREGRETCAEAVASDAALAGLPLAADPPCASPGEITRSLRVRIVRSVR
jgi:hypothetical protein